MTKHIKALFISHGGGPLPLLGDVGHQDLVICLQELAERITKPSAIIVVSAHWETSHPTITANPLPTLIYDYSGFPDQAYQIQYPCPTALSLAKQVQQTFENANINSNLDEHRGFDHGLFVPLKIMYPHADVPCIQISLGNHLDPEFHIQMGHILAQAISDEVLLIGSGFSFHNMQAFFAPESESIVQNEAFESWLIETCSNNAIDERQRKQRLINWAQAPHARYCHPREEHLLPLHVCYGLAQSACNEVIKTKVLNKKTSLYVW